MTVINIIANLLNNTIIYAIIGLYINGSICHLNNWVVINYDKDCNMR